jgi:hypothetical protein
MPTVRCAPESSYFLVGLGDLDEQRLRLDIAFALRELAILGGASATLL